MGFFFPSQICSYPRGSQDYRNVECGPFSLLCIVGNNLAWGGVTWSPINCSFGLSLLSHWEQAWVSVSEAHRHQPGLASRPSSLAFLDDQSQGSQPHSQNKLHSLHQEAFAQSGRPFHPLAFFAPFRPSPLLYRRSWTPHTPSQLL